MKKQILLSISYITEIDEELLENQEICNEKFGKHLFKDFPGQMEINDGISAKLKSHSWILLDPQFNNCIECNGNGCHELVTDLNKPKAITGLQGGMYIGDKIYCHGCFPFEQEKIKNNE